MSLDRRGQQTWRAFGGWVVAEVLVTRAVPDSVIYGGSSHFRVAGEECAKEYDRKSLRVMPKGDWPRGQHVETFPWSALATHADSIPDSLRQQIRDWRRRSTEHATVSTSWPAGRVLDAELGRLLDEAFPLAVSNEPTDLLELLAASA